LVMTSGGLKTTFFEMQLTMYVCVKMLLQTVL
jgi:hypothetical protein